MRRREINLVMKSWDTSINKVKLLNMYRCLLSVVFATILFSNLDAQQFPSQIWHSGYVVDLQADTVKGKVKYDMETNSVQVDVGNKIMSFSSHNTRYVRIFDQVADNYREFYSIPYRLKSQYRTKVFFEVLYEGPLSLLSREEITQETVPSTSIYGSAYVRERLSYSFYFLDNKGNITFYNGKRSDLYIIMGKKQKQIKEFVKTNRLKTDELRDLVRITAFYNSI